MPDIAVSDTGPILHLAEIGAVHQLGLFRVVIISEQVRAELAELGAWESGPNALSDCISVQRVSSQEISYQAKHLSMFTVHRTDLSVAALAARTDCDVVLTDDLLLRRGLESQGHQVVGSVGVLIRAFRMKQLAKSELLCSIDQLLDGSSLYTSKAFRVTIRRFLENLATSE